MSYCPKCNREYAETVERCLECDRRLIPGRRPVSVGLELEDMLIPLGALVCGLFALAMLWLRFAAQYGWIKGTFADLIQTGQPPCMTVFYAIALVASVLVLAWWFIQVVILKRG